MKGFLVAMIAVLAVVQMMAGPGEAAITCSQVAGDLAKCVPYLMHGGDPDPACCSGVKTLVGSVTNTEEKREACKCVKAAANTVTGINEDAAKALPTRCGVSMDIPISKTVNCDAISF